MIVVKKDSPYLVTTKVEVGEFFNAESADGIVELKEPDNKAFKALREAAAKEGNAAVVEAFDAALPELIVDSSFYEPDPEGGEDKKMSTAAVAALFANRPMARLKMLAQYEKEILFPQGSKTESSSAGSPV